MRSVLVVLFLTIGAVLTLSANATVWANRTVFDTDEFVSTVNDALDDETVQRQLATRLTQQLVERGDLEARVTEALPDRLVVLAPVLTRTAADLIFDIILRLLQSDRVDAVLTTALTTVHEQVLRIIEGEGSVVFEDGKVILDLGAILQQAVEESGRDNLQGLLENLNLPDDAGQIVLIDDAPRAKAIQDLLALHDTITWAVIAAAVIAYGAAIAIARNRRAMVRTVGVVIIACGVLAMVIRLPIRSLAASFAENGDAARAVVDAFTAGYVIQSFLLVLLGLGIAVGAALAGQSGLARAARGTVRRSEGEARPDLATEVRESSTFLRITGLAIGALVLVTWPDPTTRVYVTIFALLGAYFVGLWIITSDAEWAASAREWVSGFWNRAVHGSGREAQNQTWIGRHVTALRILGVVLAIVALIALPNVGAGALAAVVALTLAYLAGLDWLATQAD